MSSNNAVNGIVYIQLASYLRKLRSVEKRKPTEQRLNVPTMKELSQVAGISLASMSRIVNGHTRSLNLDIAAAIMTEMWERGFETKMTDILSFEPPKRLIKENNTPKSPTKARWPPPPLTRRQHQKYPGEEFVKVYEEGSA